MKRIVPGALAGLVSAAALAAPAHAGPTVTVRVEGEAATLLERTHVTLPDTDSPICGAGKRWTVADAIEAGTAGNWDRQPFTSTILGESHTFANSDYWALWNGSGGAYRYATVGVCDQVMAEGDEALMLVDRSGPPPDFASTSFPLALRGLPGAVQAGTPALVSVVVFAQDGTATSVAGATVSGGGAAATTAADGTATLTLAQPGTVVVKASKAGIVPSAGERVTVSTTPVAPPAPPAPAGPDTTAPTATIAGLATGDVFARSKAPRELKGSVTPDPSGLKSVRLSIMRKRGKRCWAFDGGRERFERHRCGGSLSFRIGDRADWSYLLPRRLPRGRYTIKVVAIDKVGNSAATETVIRVR